MHRDFPKRKQSFKKESNMLKRSITNMLKAHKEPKSAGGPKATVQTLMNKENINKR